MELMDPYGFDKTYLHKELIEDKLYQIITQFNEINSTFTKFYLRFLKKLHPFYDGNNTTCKIMFANDDIIR